MTLNGSEGVGCDTPTHARNCTTGAASVEVGPAKAGASRGIVWCPLFSRPPKGLLVDAGKRRGREWYGKGQKHRTEPGVMLEES